MATRSSAKARQARFVAMVSVSAVTSVITTMLFLYALPFIRPEVATLLRVSGMTKKAASQLSVAKQESTSSVSDDPLIGVVKRSQSGVVSVSVEAAVKPELMRKLLSAEWMDQDEVELVGTSTVRIVMGGGSGFFATPDGMVVTNRHVVDNQYIQEAEDVAYIVTMHDGYVYRAILVASDPVLDLAFLRVKTDNQMPYLEFGDSDSLQLGQSVIAIGNALDQFRNSITSGIVSGLHRSILAGDDGMETEVIEQAIQTDAAINLGNSGGPLLDTRGMVIGVNTAVSDSGQLLGFALPSNVVKRSLESVKRYGRVVRPFLGVRYVMVDEDIVLEHSLKAGHGAFISSSEKGQDGSVSPGSPADKAGIREGDVIMAIDGREVMGDESLGSLIGRYWPGETVPIRLNRAGVEKTVSVTFTEFPK